MIDETTKPASPVLRILVGIQHAAFASGRQASLGRLLLALADRRDHASGVAFLSRPDFTVHVQAETERRGAWTPTRLILEKGIAEGFDWIVAMNDDALPCDGFEEILRAALASVSGCEPICLYAAHPVLAEVRSVNGLGSRDATVADGDPVPDLRTRGGFLRASCSTAGVGIAISRAAAVEFLAWYDASVVCPIPNGDTPFDFWCVQTKRESLHTIPSLVGHQLPSESLCGSEGHSGRTSLVGPWPYERSRVVDWSSPPVQAPPRFGHLALTVLAHTRPETWDVEASYLALRGGKPLLDRPNLLIATPSYRAPDPTKTVRVPWGPNRTIEVDRRWYASLEKAKDVLERAGVEVGVLVTDGASLVTVARHAIQHLFLATRYTRVLLWDDDLELLEPDAPLRMLRALDAYTEQQRKAIVAGVYGYKGGGKAREASPDRKIWRAGVAANLLPETVAGQPVLVDAKHQTMPVLDVATGFMMLARENVVDVIERHPELFYLSQNSAFQGLPMWATFDTAVADRRYLTEDFNYCRLAREAGHEIRAYLDANFLHWGRSEADCGRARVRDEWLIAPVEKKASGLGPRASGKSENENGISSGAEDRGPKTEDAGPEVTP